MRCNKIPAALYKSPKTLKARGMGNRRRQFCAADASLGVTFKITQAMGNSVSSFQGKGGEDTSHSDLLRQTKHPGKSKARQNKVLLGQIARKLKEPTLTDRIPNSRVKVRFYKTTEP